MARKYAKRGVLQDRTCEICDTTFKIDQWQARNGYGRFCSRACWLVHHSPPKEQRFWSKVDRRGPDECWPWTANTFPFGYGQINWGTRNPGRAHRIAWELTHGPIPEGQQVLHTCDIPGCCNPTHLFLGDDQANKDDMRAKGRGVYGSAHGAACLTESQVWTIRKRYAAGGVSIKVLARAYQVAEETIRKIIRKQTWKHVGDRRPLPAAPPPLR